MRLGESMVAVVTGAGGGCEAAERCGAAVPIACLTEGSSRSSDLAGTAWRPIDHDPEPTRGESWT